MCSGRLPKSPAAVHAHGDDPVACRTFTDDVIGPTPPIGEGQRRMRINEIQEQIGSGQYHVNPRVVADAIIRRLFGQPRPVVPAPAPQEECS
jgi:Anti-sigma-28 factor, FlgM